MGFLFDALPLWVLTHVPLETVWLPGPFFANHPCGASGICFVASCPLSPAWSGDGLRDGTWMPPGVAFGLRNNGCALFLLPSPPLPSLTPFPSLNRFFFLALFLVTYHMFCGQAGEGEGSSSRMACTVPATEPGHCPFSNPLRPADGILIEQVRNLTAASVGELA